MPYDNAFERNLHGSPSRSENTYQRARRALKFVRVSLEDGYLTDVSISMLIVELGQRGLKIVDAEDRG